MHSLQECFFAVFIEGNMSGSHNLKYYAMKYYVSIMQKKQSSITQHYKTV